MMRQPFSRRSLLAGASALGGASLLPGAAFAKGSIVATTYPGTWEDAYRAVVLPLLKDPWVSRLGLTGFQTTFGTSSLIELSKQFGGSLTDVDPALVELKKVLPKVAAVGLPAAMPGLFQQGQCDVMYTNTQTVATLKGKGIDVEFVKPESGAIAFYTTMHIAKGTAELANAYKYLDLVAGKDVQEALTKPPYNFIPVNKDVVLPADLPMKSLDEMTKYVEHDWAKINPQRAAWIEKFNKEMAKG